tara:strand:- start:1035 stop:1514 length:480 start_codon:yes stop_codon:yes gene_type:complete
MIIPCLNCNKKFDIDQKLIPEKGRLLQCSSCNYKWFFKSIIEDQKVKISADESLELFETREAKANNTIEEDNDVAINTIITPSTEEEKTKEKEINKIKSKKNNKLLNLTIVFLISLVALIILIDTFKYPLGKIVPDLEFILYNLYESIKDFELFIRDLI